MFAIFYVWADMLKSSENKIYHYRFLNLSISIHTVEDEAKFELKLFHIQSCSCSKNEVRIKTYIFVEFWRTYVYSYYLMYCIKSTSHYYSIRSERERKIVDPLQRKVWTHEIAEVGVFVAVDKGVVLEVVPGGDVELRAVITGFL